MSAFGWHPREHRAALEGMQRLSLEERGAYNTCLDLIYDRDGPIPDDARWLAGWMGTSVRKWSKIRAALIEAGKIYAEIIGGEAFLMNERAAIEIENQSERARNSRETGAKGGRKSAEARAKDNENNGTKEGPVAGCLNLLTETETVREDSEANASGGAPPSANQKAWAEGVALLIVQGQMTNEAAKKFFGKLISECGIQPGDLLSAIGEAINNGTSDPQGYLVKAAKARALRRQSGPPRRVGWV